MTSSELSTADVACQRLSCCSDTKPRLLKAAIDVAGVAGVIASGQTRSAGLVLAMF